MERIDADVLSHNPDLVVVCFGLNDVGEEETGLKKYLNSLDSIFSKIQTFGAECIFMTPNMMNTDVSCMIEKEAFKVIAKDTAKRQNAGLLDMYLDNAKKIAEKHNVKVCDCYKKWKALSVNGVDTTELLANKINHPIREMNWLFAYSLTETIMGL